MADEKTDEFERISDPDFVTTATAREFDWKTRHKKIMRDRRRARWAARRRSLISWRTLAIVAVAAAGAGYFVQQQAKNSDSANATEASPTPTSTADDRSEMLAGRDYRRGDCVMWDRGNPYAIPTKVVPCDEPHKMQIAGRRDLPESDYPFFQQWDTVIQQECEAPVAELLGGPVDPVGRYDVTALYPLPEGWNMGDRTIWCAAAQQMDASFGPGSEAEVFTGAARADNQAYVKPVGACGDRMVVGPVSCEQPHEFEISGHLDLSGRTAPPPLEDDDAGWNALVGDRCITAARTYLGRQPPAGVDVSFQPILAQSWAAGRRTVPCLLLRHENGDVAKSTGSLKSA